MGQVIEMIDRHEDEAIEKLRSHPILSKLAGFGDKELEKILLQRRLLSLQFTPFYEQVLVGLEDERAKRVVRSLISEEYPISSPSHREDIVADLVRIGLEKKTILAEKPTSATVKIIEDLFSLVDYDDEHFELKSLMIIRLYFEVFVAEEYEFLFSEMERRFGLKPEESAFYYPHLEHDKKETPLAGKPGSGRASHSDKFNEVLARLLDSEEKAAAAVAAIDSAYILKRAFYDQFLKS